MARWKSRYHRLSKHKIKLSSEFVAMGISEVDCILSHFCGQQPPADSFDEEILQPIAFLSHPTLSTALLAWWELPGRRLSQIRITFFPAWKICC